MVGNERKRTCEPSCSRSGGSRFSYHAGPQKSPRYDEDRGRRRPSTDTDDMEEAERGMDNLTTSENPLLNYLVMKKVFELLEPNVTTMKNLRLVCKLWFDLLLSRWRSTAVLTLVQEDHEPRLKQLRRMLHRPYYFREYELMRGLYLADYEYRVFHPDRDFLQMDKVPFSRFCFKGWTCECTCTFGGSYKFWRYISELLTYLRLQDCEFRYKKDHKNPSTIYLFLSVVFQRTPRLEHLIMSGCIFPAASYSSVSEDVRNFRYGYRENESTFGRMNRGSCVKVHEYPHARKLENLKTLVVDGELPIYWVQFLRYTPNLTKIHSMNDGSGDFNSLIWAIMVVRRHDYKRLNITDLDVAHTSSFQLDLQEVEILRTARLPLESLSLRLGEFGGTITQEAYEELPPPLVLAMRLQVWESHMETLKILRIFREITEGGPLKLFEFGVILHNLEELYLYGHVTTSFRFLLDTPNLKKLYINRFCVEDLQPLWPTLDRYPKGDRQLDTDMVQNTGAALNLLVFERMEFFSIDNQVLEPELRQLATWMPNLKCLRMVLNNLTLQVAGRLWPNLEEVTLLMGSMPSDNGLGIVCRELRKVRKFELITCCGKQKCGSHVGMLATMGFCRMPELRSLKVCVGETFTWEVERLLRQRIDEVTIIRRYDEDDCPHLRRNCREHHEKGAARRAQEAAALAELEARAAP